MKLLLINLFLVSCFVISCNQPTNEEQTKGAAEDLNEETLSGNAKKDADFIVEAYTHSLMLREYGHVAMEKEGIPAAITEFAKTSVEFNENINKQLTQMTVNTKIVLPTSIGENVLRFKEKLQETRGKDFAEKYMNVVGEIQSKMISDYQKAFNRTENAQLSEWLQVAIPQINEREEYADQLSAYADDIE
ncbi:DUF4142 domain-containing protein [Fulvivirga imtechensis]|nr:DUF4142 domain-containing protein [Fulvivirga imtechensis]